MRLKNLKKRYIIETSNFPFFFSLINYSIIIFHAGTPAYLSRATFVHHLKIARRDDIRITRSRLIISCDSNYDVIDREAGDRLNSR